MTQEALLTLLNDLSLDEKVGQLCQIDMSTFLADAGSPTGPMLKFNLTREQIVSAGSVICGANADPERYARVHETFRKEAPHGIPPLMMSDVIHGMRTIFPIPLALACSFDEDTAETMARVSAKEAASSGLHVTFSPMLDVCRDPRWGRCMESPGESPALCGAMGAAMVRGYRGKGLKEKDTVATCAKHFAGYALVEAGREYAPVDVSRTEMYNTYLPPFQAALDAGCDMVMPAFTPVDRVPAVANRWLMNDVLRKRWQWNGMTISDWGSPNELIRHGMAADLKEAALLCFRASMDMDMLSFAYMSSLKELVEEGAIAMSELDAAVLRVLELKNAMGLFENPNKNDSVEEQLRIRHLPEHREAALQAAIKSCVLLKNDGALPVAAGTKVALVGDHADTHRLLGFWREDGREDETPTLMEAFCKDARITLVQPEDADVILFATGEDQDDVGEASSKLNPALTAAQKAELDALCQLGKPVVMILFCGRPLMIADDVDKCSAVLNAWFPGNEGAEAIRRLVMGDENPSGHLAMTFPRCLGQIPIHHDQLSTGRPTEIITDSFVSVYKDGSNKPLYPFGYGLSYTSFQVDGAKVGGESLKDGLPVDISVRVTNTGERSGTAVVQLYFRGRRLLQMSPMRTLLAWKRVSLAAGESAEVVFTVEKEQLRTWDAEGHPVEAEGVYDFYIGEDSEASLSACVHVC